MHGLADGHLAHQLLGDPVEGGHVTLRSANQQLPAVPRVVHAVGPVLAQTQVELLGGRGDVDGGADI